MNTDSLCPFTGLLTHVLGICMFLLDIPRQPTCMKLGTGGAGQPIQSYVCKQGSCCPVWALQHIHTYIPHHNTILLRSRISGIPTLIKYVP